MASFTLSSLTALEMGQEGNLAELHRFLDKISRSQYLNAQVWGKKCVATLLGHNICLLLKAQRGRIKQVLRGSVDPRMRNMI